MTEQHEDRMPAPNSWEHALWLRQRREAYETAEAQRKEDRERGAKQAAMEAFLKRRGKEWMEHAGTMPPREIVEDWRREYVEAQFRGEDPAHESRVARAEDIGGGR